MPNAYVLHIIAADYPPLRCNLIGTETCHTLAGPSPAMVVRYRRYNPAANCSTLPLPRGAIEDAMIFTYIIDELRKATHA